MRAASVYVVFIARTAAHTGTSYTHRMREMEDRKQYLVHFPTLLQLAKKLQLEMVEVVNFIDFYEDHKKSHEAALTEIMGWTKTNKKLFPNQLELIGTLH